MSRILITGANRGIGARLTELYHAQGEHVIATARATEGYLPLNVTAPASVTACAKSLEGQTIDLLVCNAGVYQDKGQSLDEGYPAEMWAESFATNVTGVFLTVQAFLPHLRRSEAGKIAIISSQMASHTRAPGGSYIYRSSKAAALNLARNLATDLKPEGIAVAAYHPGWARSDMGGEHADITVSEAAEGLLREFDALSLATTGAFRTWDGRDHAY